MSGRAGLGVNAPTEVRNARAAYQLLVEEWAREFRANVGLCEEKVTARLRGWAMRDDGTWPPIRAGPLNRASRAANLYVRAAVVSVGRADVRLLVGGSARTEPGWKIPTVLYESRRDTVYAWKTAVTDDTGIRHQHFDGMRLFWVDRKGTWNPEGMDDVWTGVVMINKMPRVPRGFWIQAWEAENTNNEWWAEGSTMKETVLQIFRICGRGRGASEPPFREVGEFIRKEDGRDLDGVLDGLLAGAVNEGLNRWGPVFPENHERHGTETLWPEAHVQHRRVGERLLGPAPCTYCELWDQTEEERSAAARQQTRESSEAARWLEDPAVPLWRNYDEEFVLEPHVEEGAAGSSTGITQPEDWPWSRSSEGGNPPPRPVRTAPGRHD